MVPCFISVFIIPSGWASARRHRVIRSNSINEKRFPAVLKRIVITPFHPFFSVAKPRSETRISIIYFGIFSVYPEHGKVRNCRASPTRNSRLKVKSNNPGCGLKLRNNGLAAYPSPTVFLKKCRFYRKNQFLKKIKLLPVAGRFWRVIIFSCIYALLFWKTVFVC